MTRCINGGTVRNHVQSNKLRNSSSPVRNAFSRSQAVFSFGVALMRASCRVFGLQSVLVFLMRSLHDNL
jgi:hypothetical protein